MVLESRRRIVTNSECENIYTNIYINTLTYSMYIYTDMYTLTHMSNNIPVKVAKYC